MKKNILVIVTFLLLVAFTTFFATSIGWYQISTNANNENPTLNASSSSYQTKKYYDGIYLVGSKIRGQDVPGSGDTDKLTVQYYDNKFESDKYVTQLYAGDKVAIREFSNNQAGSILTTISGKYRTQARTDGNYLSTDNVTTCDISYYTNNGFISIDNGVISINKGGFYTFTKESNSNTIYLQIDYKVQIGYLNDASISYNASGTGTPTSAAVSTSTTYVIPAVKGGSYNLRSLYYDNSTTNWSKVYVFYWGSNISATTWPGIEMEVKGGSVYTQNVPKDAIGLVFSNGSGSKTSDIAGDNLKAGFTATYTKQFHGLSDGGANVLDSSYTVEDIAGNSATKLSDYFYYTKSNNENSIGSHVYQGFESYYFTHKDTVNGQRQTIVGIDAVCDGFADSISYGYDGVITTTISSYLIGYPYLVGTIRGNNYWSTASNDMKFSSGDAPFDANHSSKLIVTLHKGDVVKVRMFKNTYQSGHDIYIPSTWDSNQYNIDNTGLQQYHWWYMNWVESTDNWDDPSTRNGWPAASTNWNAVGQFDNLVINKTGQYVFEIDARYGYGAINVSYYGSKMYYVLEDYDNNGDPSKLTPTEFETEQSITIDGVSRRIYYSYFGGTALSDVPTEKTVANDGTYVFAGWYGYKDVKQGDYTNISDTISEILDTKDYDDIFDRQNYIIQSEGLDHLEAKDLLYAYAHKEGTYLLGIVQSQSENWQTGNLISSGSLSSGSTVVYLNAGDKIKARDFAYARSGDSSLQKGWYELGGVFNDTSKDAYGNSKDKNGNYVVETGNSGFYRIDWSIKENSNTRVMTVTRVYKATLNTAINKTYFSTSTNNDTINRRNGYLVDSYFYIDGANKWQTASTLVNNEYKYFFYSDQTLSNNNDTPYNTNASNFRIWTISTGANMTDDSTNYGKTENIEVYEFDASVAGIFIAGSYTGAKKYVISTDEGGHFTNTSTGLLNGTTPADTNGLWYSNSNILLGSSTSSMNSIVYLPANAEIRLVDYQNSNGASELWLNWNTSNVSAYGTLGANNANLTITNAGYYKFRYENYVVSIDKYNMLTMHDDIRTKKVDDNNKPFYGNTSATYTIKKYLVPYGTELHDNSGTYNGLQASVLTKFNGWYTGYNFSNGYLNFSGTSDVDSTTISEVTSATGDIDLYSYYTVNEFRVYLDGVQVTTTSNGLMKDSTSILTGEEIGTHYQASIPVSQVTAGQTLVIKTTVNNVEQILSFKMTGDNDANALARNNLVEKNSNAVASSWQIKYSSINATGSADDLDDLTHGWGAVIHLKASRDTASSDFEVWVESTYRYYFDLTSEWTSGNNANTIITAKRYDNKQIQTTISNTGTFISASNTTDNTTVDKFNFVKDTATACHIDLSNEYYELKFSRSGAFMPSHTVFFEKSNNITWNGVDAYLYAENVSVDSTKLEQDSDYKYIYVISSVAPKIHIWGGSTDTSYDMSLVSGYANLYCYKYSGTPFTKYQIHDGTNYTYEISRGSNSFNSLTNVELLHYYHDGYGQRYSTSVNDLKATICNNVWPGEVMTWVFDKDEDKKPIYAYYYGNVGYEKVRFAAYDDPNNDNKKSAIYNLSDIQTNGNTFLWNGTSWSSYKIYFGATGENTFEKYDYKYANLYSINKSIVLELEGFSPSYADLCKLNFHYENGDVKTITVPNGGALETLPTTDGLETGYQVSWYTDPEFASESRINSISNVSQAEYDFYGKLEAKTYTIILDTNKGTGSTDPTTVGNATATFDSSTITGLSNSSRTGYTFGGWYKEAACTNLIINTSGELQVSDYTDEAGNWTTNSNVTLYAKWTANEYTITINDGIENTPLTTKVKFDSSVITSFTPRTKSHYILTYYYLENDSSTLILANTGNGFVSSGGNDYVSAQGKWIHDGNINVTADFEQITYVLATNPASGTNVSQIEWLNSSNQVITSASYETTGLKIRLTTKIGYHFGNDNATNTYTFSGISLLEATSAFAFDDSGDTPTATYTFTIPDNISINKYTVTIQSNNSSYGLVNSNSSIIVNDVEHNSNVDISSNTLTLKSTNYIATPTDNTNAYHYAFSGWSVNDDYVNDDYKVTGNVTITATFICTPQTYSVSFDKNGGSGDAMSALNITYGAGSTSLTSNTYTRAGYTFNGWNTKDDGTGTTYANGAQISNLTANLTLYAQWTQDVVTITLARNEESYGKLSKYSITVPKGTTYTTTTNSITFNDNIEADYFNGETITATPSEQTAQYAYGLDSWSSNSGTLNADATITKSFSQTVRSYDISIISNDTNCGTVNVATISSVDYGTTITVSDNTITINGTTVTATKTTNGSDYTYTFNGWKYSSNGSAVKNNDTTDEKTAIVASFSKTGCTYSVSFNGNGNTSGSMTTPMSITYGESAQSITANAFSRTGYEFAGWNTKADGTGNPYDDNATISNLTANITLYAQWTAHTYTVTFTHSVNGVEGYANNSNSNSITYNYDQVIDLKTIASYFSKANYVVSGYIVTGTDFNSSTAKRGDSITPATAITKDSTFTDRYVKNLTAVNNSTNVTVQIQWQQLFKINFHINEGTGTIPAYLTYATDGSEKFGTGKTGFVNTDLTKSGYTFAGWSKDNNTTSPTLIDVDQLINATFMGTDNSSNQIYEIDVYAVWKHTITFTSRNTTDNGNVTHDDVVYNTTTHNYYSSATIPTATNTWSLSGWTTADDILTRDWESGTKDSYANNTVLYAVYSRTITAKVRYSSDYGTAPSGTTDATATQYRDIDGDVFTGNGESITFTGTLDSTTMSETGYTFGGWKDSASGGTNNQAISGSLQMNSTIASRDATPDNITLYAQWTENSTTYYIVVGSNGTVTASEIRLPNDGTPTRSASGKNSTNNGTGTITFTGSTCDYFTSGTVITANPSANYRFDSWSYNSSTRTYTANFTLNTFTVSFATTNGASAEVLSRTTDLVVPYGSTMSASSNRLTITNVLTGAATSIDASVDNSKDANYNYTFSSWSGYGTVKSNKTVTATYTRTDEIEVWFTRPNNNNDWKNNDVRIYRFNAGYNEGWPGINGGWNYNNDYGEAVYKWTVKKGCTVIFNNDNHGLQTVNIVLTYNGIYADYVNSGVVRFYVSGGSGNSHTVSTW